MSPTTNEQEDRIQQIINALNQIPGIEFAEDAWEEKAPNNYGVVELMGEAGNDYADGKRIAKGYLVEITIYVTGGSHGWIEKVEAVLDGLQLPHTLPQREYTHEIKKVCWRWQTRLRKSILRDAATVSGDSGTLSGGSDPENGGSDNVSGTSDPENAGSDNVSGGSDPENGISDPENGDSNTDSGNSGINSGISDPDAGTDSGGGSAGTDAGASEP